MEEEGTEGKRRRKREGAMLYKQQFEPKYFFRPELMKRVLYLVYKETYIKDIRGNLKGNQTIFSKGYTQTTELEALKGKSKTI